MFSKLCLLSFEVTRREKEVFSFDGDGTLSVAIVLGLCFK